MTPKMQKAREKAAELQQELTSRIEALTTSEDWLKALEVASRFHRYSFANVMLIAWQRPDATRVAGYRKWQQEFNRTVRPGEKAIRILAPMIVKGTKTNDDGEESEYRQLIGYKTVSVFDISQTEGDPLPDMVMPERLSGDADGKALEVADMAEALIHEAGFTVSRDGDWEGSKNGQTDYGLQAVTIKAGLDPAQTAKTMVHELAHVRMHRPGMSDRGHIEIEAESVAYVVCNALDIETADYSLPYVAHWAGGDVEKVRKAGTAVVKAAHEIIDSLSQAAVPVAA